MKSKAALLFVLLFLGTVTSGCATTGNSAATAHDGKVHAECLVCKKNADLACVDIPVDASTPKFSYAGKDYYFCSDECKNDFAKQPAKYVSSK